MQMNNDLQAAMFSAMSKHASDIAMELLQISTSPWSWIYSWFLEKNICVPDYAIMKNLIKFSVLLCANEFFTDTMYL